MAGKFIHAKKNTLWQSWCPYVLPRYESQHTVIQCLLPLAVYHPIHSGRKPQSPNLLSLYEPLPFHVIGKKTKKSLSGFTRFISCVLLQNLAQIKYLPFCSPAHSPGLTYLPILPLCWICKARNVLGQHSPSTFVPLSTVLS